MSYQDANSTSLFGSASKAGISQANALPQFGTAMSSGTKKFLPGRPSLQDMFNVAPSWKTAFEQLNSELNARDADIGKLKSLISTLNAQNKSQKAQLSGNIETSKAQIISQLQIEREIELLHPSVRKLNRQCSALTVTCERTLEAPSQQPQPLTIPRPEYLQFLRNLSQRSQVLQERATSLQNSVDLLKEELSGTQTSPISNIKTTLGLLMAEYRQLKMRHLGLHEELQTCIERHKETYRFCSGFDVMLSEASKQSPIEPITVDALFHPSRSTN